MSSAVTKRAAAKAESTLDTLEQQASTALQTASQKIDSIADIAAPKVEGQRSKLPPVIQFPLAATLSFAVASLGYSLLGEVTKGELASVSRSQDTWGEVGVLAGWRLLELAVGWFGKFDSLDVAMMDLLSHGPALYLLTSFYGLSPTTALSALLVDTLSASLPFYLLRPLSSYHSTAVTSFSLLDSSLLLYTTFLSTAIYAVTLVLSLTLLLPSVLITNFSGLPTLLPAYNASYTQIAPVTLLFGFAAAVFIFAPFAAAKKGDKVENFDPATATLGETLRWNFWAYDNKTKVVITRTAVAAVVTAVNTFLSCTMTIYGVRNVGAAIYAGVWAVAALATGVGLGLVGGE